MQPTPTFREDDSRVIDVMEGNNPTVSEIGEMEDTMLMSATHYGVVIFANLIQL